MHVPFIVQWKGMVEPGESDAIVCQVDFLASFAKMLGEKVPDESDSQNVFDALMGRSEKGRKELVLESFRNLSFRSENWYLVPPARNEKDKKAELFDLSKDPSQKTGVAAEHPDIVKALSERLEESVK